MRVTHELIECLEEYNSPYANEEIIANFRVYYVLKNKMVKNAFCINKDNHTLAQSNKIAKRLFELMYDESYTIEYTGQIIEQQINPMEYTGKNEVLEHYPSLYIM